MFFIWMLMFWLSAGLLAYHLVGYPVLLLVWNSLFKKKENPITDILEYPRITVLCPAFNEEKVIEDKLKSFLELDYPKDQIDMIVISDDSTDGTNEIVQRYSGQNISLIIQKPRAGKQSAHNLVLPRLDCDYVLSTDANSIFEPVSVRLLVGRMLSKPRVGMVSGELRLLRKADRSSGEGTYWRYESFIKEMDSRFKCLIGANGSIFLIKKDLFGKVDPQSVDDFERTLEVLKKGYLVLYEPQAMVFEEETEKASQEISRKIRIISQEWFAMRRNAVLLNPFRFPAISFLLFSHKLIRWLFFVFVLTALLSSAFLANYWFYRYICLLQIVAYLLGTAGLIAQSKGRHLPLTGLPGYFMAMVWASAVAFKNFLLNKNFGVWKPIR